MLNLVKVGGRVVDDPDALAGVAAAVAGMQGRVVVVHGGGAEITYWHERLGIPTEWRDGLRVTTPEGVQVASMALSGWTNKRLVGAMTQAGLQAVGLSGEDGGLVVAFKKAGGALGEVGTVAAVQPRVLEVLLEAGFIPVVSPLSMGPGGGPLNVNADEVAGALAVALGANRLYLVSDTPGVKVDGHMAASLDPDQAADLLERGIARDGMAVKLRVAVAAAREGVHVSIGDAGILDGAGGTRVLGGGSALGAA